MANADAANAHANPDAFANGQGDDDGGFNSEVASANQVASRNVETTLSGGPISVPTGPHVISLSQ